MFTVDGTVYTLKYNKQKLKTIELVTKTSVIGEMAKNNGVLPYPVLESLFSLALVEESTNSVVKQKDAENMFETVIEENGLITVNAAIVQKLQDDMGFMFR